MATRWQDRIKNRARTGLNTLQDRVVAFEREGGFQALSERLSETIRRQEARFVDASRMLDSEHHLQVRQWYARLELPHGANREEVRRQFRELMRRYHPDRYADDPQMEKLANRISQELTVAYEGLQRHLGTSP